MAKATAKCTCKTCGATFTKTEVKQTRALADSWEKWAETHYDTCPKCYAAKNRKEETRSPVSCSIRAQAVGDDLEYWAVFSGNTYPIKDDLKALGCKWTADYPRPGLAGLLAVAPPPKSWALKFAASEVYETYDRICAICVGGDIELPDDHELFYAQMESRKNDPYNTAK